MALAFTFLLCFAYLITLQRALWPRFNWLLAELIFTAVASVSLFLSSLLLIGFTTREDYRLSLTYYDSYIGTTYFATYIAAGVSFTSGGKLIAHGFAFSTDLRTLRVVRLCRGHLPPLSTLATPRHGRRSDQHQGDEHVN